MLKRIRILLVVNWIFFTFLLTAGADTIILNEGKEIKCSIISINDTEARITVDEVEVCIPMSRIKEIKEETEPTPAPPQTITSPFSAPGTPPQVSPLQEPRLSAPEGTSPLGLPSLDSVSEQVAPQESAPDTSPFAPSPVPPSSVTDSGVESQPQVQPIAPGPFSSFSAPGVPPSQSETTTPLPPFSAPGQQTSPAPSTGPQPFTGEEGTQAPQAQPIAPAPSEPFSVPSVPPRQSETTTPLSPFSAPGQQESPVPSSPFSAPGQQPTSPPPTGLQPFTTEEQEGETHLTPPQSTVPPPSSPFLMPVEEASSLPSLSEVAESPEAGLKPYSDDQESQAAPSPGRTEDSEASYTFPGLTTTQNRSSEQDTQEPTLRPFTDESEMEAPPSSPAEPIKMEVAMASTDQAPAEPGDERPEFRAAWVSRFEWPVADAAACKKRISQIMEKLAQANFNAVIFQVRGQGDVLYPSPYEPWSKIFQYQDPGFDPLEFAIQEAHDRGLEFHAWLNVHPVWQGTDMPPATNPPHPVFTYCQPDSNPNWLCYNKSGEMMDVQASSDNYLYFSPGIPEFMDYFRKIVMDVVMRYDVDGIHYDRVRYPGPNYSHDPVSLERFQGDGNPDNLGWEDWQRRQITVCLERVYADVMALKPHVKITAAVWGIYNKQEIPGYSRFSSGFHDYYQDSIQWDKEGAVDALIPMIYWAMNDERKPDYDELLDYFALKTTNHHLYGSLTCWEPVQKVLEAVEYTRNKGVPGIVIFSWGKLNGLNYLSHLQTDLYSSRVDTPEMPWKRNPATGIILGKVTNKANNQPIADALVTVSQTGKHRLSSADGTFALLEVAPGIVPINVTKDGVGTAEVEATVEAGKVARLDVAL